MIEWKDKTSYSQRDKDRVPRVFHASVGNWRISVHRHIDYPGSWLLSTTPDLFSRHVLDSDGLDEAQVEALTKIKMELQWLLEELE